MLYLTAEHAGHNPQPLKRVAKVHAYIDKAFHEIFVDVSKADILRHEILHGRHSHIDTAYMKKVEAVCLDDERIQAEIKALELPEGATVIVEPWTYATDGANDMRQRITMVRVSKVLCLTREP